MTRRDWRYSLLALVVIGLLTSGIMIAMQVLFSDFNHTPVVYDFGSAFTGKILAIACMVALLVAQYRKRRVLLESFIAIALGII